MTGANTATSHKSQPFLSIGGENLEDVQRVTSYDLSEKIREKKGFRVWVQSRGSRFTKLNLILLYPACFMVCFSFCLRLGYLHHMTASVNRAPPNNSNFISRRSQYRRFNFNEMLTAQ
jgi:hypothetical protein